MSFKISFIVFFISLFFQPLVYSNCFDFFNKSIEKSVFETMKKQQDNYAEFSVREGKVHSLAFKSKTNSPQFLELRKNTYNDSYIFDVLKEFGHESLLL